MTCSRIFNQILSLQQNMPRIIHVAEQPKVLNPIIYSTATTLMKAQCRLNAQPGKLDLSWEFECCAVQDPRPVNLGVIEGLPPRTNPRPRRGIPLAPKWGRQLSDFQKVPFGIPHGARH